MIELAAAVKAEGRAPGSPVRLPELVTARRASVRL